MSYDAVKHRKYYQNNKETYLARAVANNRKYYERNRAFVNAFKEQSGCAKCKQNFPACALDLHHEQDDKEHNISSLVRSSYSMKALKIELEKCIVLCACCHRIHHYADVAEVVDASLSKSGDLSREGSSPSIGTI